MAPSDDTTWEHLADESNLKQDKKKKGKTKLMPEAVDRKPGDVKLELQSQVDGKPKDKKKKKGSSDSLVETTEQFKIAPDPISEIPLVQKKNKSKEKRRKQEISDSDEALAGRVFEVTHQDEPTTKEISEDAVDKQNKVSKKRKRPEFDTKDGKPVEELDSDELNRRKTKATEETKTQEASYYLKYQAEFVAYKKEIECSLEDADYVRFTGIQNPYRLIHCHSPEQTHVVEAALRQLCLRCKSFPNFRKLSPLCIATEQRGMSLRLFLQEYKGQLFFGPTLLKLRVVLIDLIEGFRHLMDTRIKSALSLDNIFVDVGGSGLHVTFTQFVCRPGDTEATNSEWSKFANFVKVISEACGYGPTHPTMVEFLSCLKPKNGRIPEASELERISVIPLFWDGAKRLRFFMQVTGAYVEGRIPLKRSCVTLPHGWKSQEAGGGIKLGELLRGIPVCSNNKQTNAWNCLKAFQNEIAHFVCKADGGYPQSRQDMLCHMEKVIPNLMHLLIRFVEENDDKLGMHLPKGEKRLRGLSK